MPRFKVTYIDYIDAENAAEALLIAEAAVKEDMVFAEYVTIEEVEGE